MLSRVWQNLNVETVPAARCARLAPRWAALSRVAQEPSCMQLPEMQLALLAHNNKAQVHTVTHGDTLLLALTSEPKRGYDRTAQADLTNCSLPLVSRDLPQEAVAAFANGLSRPLLLKDLPTDGAFFQQLTQVAGHLQVIQKWQRAALVVKGSFETWLDTNFDQKRRKELKRLRKRLSEQGQLKLETLSKTCDFNAFVDDFIQLEAQGWKGKRGTALNSQQQQVATFRGICEALHHSGRLRFWVMRLDGKPVAALFGIVAGSGAQIIKIAYDEAFAKFSPGVQIVLAATEAFFSEPGLETVDSCAIPDHPMINRIWRERLNMADVLIASPHYPAWIFGSVCARLKLSGKLRRMAKVVFLTVMRRKKS